MTIEIPIRAAQTNKGPAALKQQAPDLQNLISASSSKNSSSFGSGILSVSSEVGSGVFSVFSVFSKLHPSTTLLFSTISSVCQEERAKHSAIYGLLEKKRQVCAVTRPDPKPGCALRLGTGPYRTPPAVFAGGSSTIKALFRNHSAFRASVYHRQSTNMKGSCWGRIRLAVQIYRTAPDTQNTSWRPSWNEQRRLS